MIAAASCRGEHDRRCPGASPERARRSEASVLESSPWPPASAWSCMHGISQARLIVPGVQARKGGWGAGCHFPSARPPVPWPLCRHCSRPGSPHTGPPAGCKHSEVLGAGERREIREGLFVPRKSSDGRPALGRYGYVFRGRLRRTQQQAQQTQPQTWRCRPRRGTHSSWCLGPVGVTSCPVLVP